MSYKLTDYYINARNEALNRLHTPFGSNIKEPFYEDIPEALFDQYTMNQTIDFQITFRDPKGKNGVIDEKRNWSDTFIEKFKQETSDFTINPDVGYGYEQGAERMVMALNDLEVKEKKVAIIGSINPWLEAIALNNNCSITSVEYNVPECDYPNLSCIHWDDFESSKETYDCILSYSSIEHSGLGRYGDPLIPDADLNATKVIKSKLKTGGLFFLAVPIWDAGRNSNNYHANGSKKLFKPDTDLLVWNCHRVYGSLRWPLLTNGFTELARYRFPECKKIGNGADQPIVVLKKTQ